MNENFLVASSLPSLSYLQEIVEKAARLSGYQESDICKPDEIKGSRTFPLPNLRGLIVERARSLPEKQRPPFKLIGWYLGGRDHSTAYQALVQFETLIEIKDEWCTGAWNAYINEQPFPKIKERANLNHPKFAYPAKGINGSNWRINFGDMMRVLAQSNVPKEVTKELSSLIISRGYNSVKVETFWNISSHYIEKKELILTIENLRKCMRRN